MSAWIGSHGGDRHYEPPSSKASLDRIADALEAIAKTQRETVEILLYVHGLKLEKANAARAKP